MSRTAMSRTALSCTALSCTACRRSRVTGHLTASRVLRVILVILVVRAIRTVHRKSFPSETSAASTTYASSSLPRRRGGHTPALAGGFYTPIVGCHA
jgi:hypothetical protein